MKRTPPSSNPVWDQLNLAGSLADLKEQHYRVLLAFGALIDLLEAKGLLSREELEDHAIRLDREADPRITRSPASLHHPKG